MPYQSVKCLDEDELSELDADAIKAKYKYHNSRVLRQQQDLDDALKMVRTATAAGLGIDELKTQYECFKNRLHNVIVCLELLEEKDATNKARYTTELANNRKVLKTASDSIPGEILRAEAQKAKALAKIETANDKKVNFVRHLQPKELSQTSSLAEKKMWRMQFDAFYSSSNFDMASIQDQQHYLLMCLSRNLGANLLRRIVQGATIIYPYPQDATIKSCLGELDKIFDLIHPVVARRQQLLRMSRQDGESYINWSTRLKNAADEADIGKTITREELLCLMLVAFSHDSYLDAEFRRLETPTIKKLDDIGVAWDRGENFNKDYSNAPIAAAEVKVQKAVASNKTQAKPKRGLNPNGPKDESVQKFLAGRCFKCGSSAHVAADCPQSTLQCSHCGMKGHLVNVCLDKAGLKQKKSSQNASSRQSYPAPSHETHSQPVYAHSSASLPLNSSASSFYPPANVHSVSTTAARQSHSRPTPPLDL